MGRLLNLFRFAFWLCFIALTGLALSPAPYLPPLDIFNWLDKAQHAIGYGALMLTAILSYPNISKLHLAALLGLHGCLIEVLQYFSGYRFGDWQDAAADGVGVLLGWVLGTMAQSLLSSKFESMSGLSNQASLQTSTYASTDQAQAKTLEGYQKAGATASSSSRPIATANASSKEKN